MKTQSSYCHSCKYRKLDCWDKPCVDCEYLREHWLKDLKPTNYVKAK